MTGHHLSLNPPFLVSLELHITTHTYIYIWYYIRAKQMNRLRSSKKIECLRTPHHFHIHILRHPLLLQLCKNYLRKSQLNIQKVVICKVLNITLLRALYIWWSIAGSSIFGWPSLLRKSSVEFQVLLLQMKDVLGLNEELTQCERLRTHFCRSNPIKSCRPMRANTLRQNTVKIITSASFFTDWIRAPTMVFRPCVCVCGEETICIGCMTPLQKPLWITFRHFREN